MRRPYPHKKVAWCWRLSRSRTAKRTPTCRSVLPGRVCSRPGALGAGHSPVRSSAASLSSLSLRVRPWGGLPGPCVPGSVVPRLSRPGPEAQPRGTHPRPRVVSPPKPRLRPVPCCSGPSFPSRGTSSPRAGRGIDCPLQGTWICVLFGNRNCPARLGTGRAGTRRRRHCPNAPELVALQAIGAELSRVVWPGPLAEAHGKVGRPEEGLTLLTEALAAVDKTGGRFQEAELYRIKGVLTLQKFQVSGSKFQVPSPQHLTPSTQAEAEAEACFQKAIE